MLPFLKPKQDGGVAGVIIKNRPSDNPSESQDLPATGLELCAQMMIEAIHAGDSKKLAEVLKEAIEQSKRGIPEPHSYDAQNVLAAHEDR